MHFERTTYNMPHSCIIDLILEIFSTFKGNCKKYFLIIVMCYYNNLEYN